MGIILGFLCFFSFGLLFVKVITRKLHLRIIDKFLMRSHKSISVVFIILCFLHVIFVVPVLENRSIFVVISGILMVFFLFILVILCPTIKKYKIKILCHRILAMLMAICVIGHIVAYYGDFIAYQQKVTNIVFDNIDLVHIKDGIYEGECDVGYIYAKVSVEIKDDKIMSVTLLEHRNERGKMAEVILNDVVANQKIYVDVVSSATNSSNVLKKAIENAVKNAIE